MIAHASLPARDPKATALLLGALIDGETFPFPVVPGAWIAVARDGSGTAIEVYPRRLAHHPGRGEPDPHHVPNDPRTMPWEDQIHDAGDQLRPSAFHLALTTKLSTAQIERVATAAGVRSVRCDRAGVFRLVELWLDGTHLIEVLTAAEAERYRRFMNPQAAAAMFGPGLAPVVG